MEILIRTGSKKCYDDICVKYSGVIRILRVQIVSLLFSDLTIKAWKLKMSTALRICNQLR